MGRFIWHDLMTTDAEAARGFYGELCGWQFDEMKMGPVTVSLIRVGESRVGGIMPEKEIASHWMPYLAVDDTDAACKRITELGGKVCIPPMNIPKLGRFAVADDPAGAHFSILRRPDGTPPPPERETPGMFASDHLLSLDPEGAAAFYGALGGVELERRGEIFTVEDRVVITKQRTREHGSAWFPSINVVDVDAATRRAVSLGGKVVLEPRQPEGMSRFSVLLDAVGAVVGLTQKA